ncbi:hypothetical protein LTR09_001888 [Extremus antarcticus]|uniref:GH64 domain-containing protein n=1 Tax=Extremus antarcticus TaxID=702011 RepID=A0AAJ0LWA4_9PEZI|nr:hypothetical protein LTR09_001888 [Extremus antarcticus]
MKVLLTFMLAAAGMIISVSSAPTGEWVTVDPGNATDIVITSANTLNATKPAPHISDTPNAAGIDNWSDSGRLQLALVNNFPNGTIYAYVMGFDRHGHAVMLSPDGTFCYPTADKSIATPQPVAADIAIRLGARGSTTNIAVPDYISAARVWVSEGNELSFHTVHIDALGGPTLVQLDLINPTDPNSGINWGFLELTYTEKDGLYADLTNVDFVGLELGLKLKGADGTEQTVPGLLANATSTICAELKAQSKIDRQPWGDLCKTGDDGRVLRVLSPTQLLSANSSAFEDYWTDYNNKVWERYAANELIINTGGVEGEVKCRVSGEQMLCDGDDKGYSKPTAQEIFGCNSGPFSNVDSNSNLHKPVTARFCAAYHRGGNIQPGPSAENYYSSEPSSYYNKFVHEHQVDGKGYAFAYDDVNPANDVDQSGTVSSMQPELLTIIVGGPLDTEE